MSDHYELRADPRNPKKKRRFCLVPNCHQSYSSECSTTHLVNHTKTHAIPAKQQSLELSFGTAANKSFHRCLASLFVRANIPFHLVEKRVFKELAALLRGTPVAPSCTRKTLAKHVPHSARSYREMLVEQLKRWDDPVTIAIDGWTNVNHTKVNNMMLIARGRAFYWKSVVNNGEHNTARWMSEQFIKVFDLLQSLGIKFAGLALDNENTQTAFFNLMQQKFDFLIHIPCSAHIIQLVARSILEHETIRHHLDKMVSIINDVASSKAKRIRIAQDAELDDILLVLLKPNATRWNSWRKATMRFLELTRYIAAMYVHDSAVNWQQLRSQKGLRVVVQLLQRLKIFI